ncbi:MAG: hypothetical protein ABI375_00455 [Rudaea sp.]
MSETYPTTNQLAKPSITKRTIHDRRKDSVLVDGNQQPNHWAQRNRIWSPGRRQIGFPRMTPTAQRVLAGDDPLSHPKHHHAPLIPLTGNQGEQHMELIGSYHACGYTVEAYFPEHDAPDTWTIWVVRDGRVVRECTTRIAVDSVQGMDHLTMARIEGLAQEAVKEVMRREARAGQRSMDALAA